MKVISALFFLAAALRAFALPNGPPETACEDIFPGGHSSPSNEADPNANPFELDISAFNDSSSASGFSYIPGETYQLTLSGENNEEYRGLMVQARTVADDSPVGTFSDFTANTEQSVCSSPESAVTHNSPVVKTNEVLTWTAPPSNTGPLRFLYAVVVRFDSGIINMFFATLETDMIAEGTVTVQPTTTVGPMVTESQAPEPTQTPGGTMATESQAPEPTETPGGTMATTPGHATATAVSSFSLLLLALLMAVFMM